MHSPSLPLALLVSFGMAAALPATTETNPEFPSLVLTFKGAGDADGTYYYETVVANGNYMSIGENLSLSSISVERKAGYVCTSRSKDGSETRVGANEREVAVGPPQPQDFVRCSRL
ncbi:hypothetical protein PG984_015201 [Apiospora sp. TS-2023a]